MTDHSSVDPEFRAGDRLRTEIGEFEVQQVLGAGGMGVVYQVVRDERHGGRQFALKTILPELLSRPEVIERFEAEGRVLSKFDHENIIKIDGIFDMLSEPRRPFILMELLQGYTLRFVMDRYKEPFSVNDVCTVAIGMCNALEEIHKNNVVHRDIKPDNIFIQKRRKRTRVVLIDFGIMKVVLGSASGQARKSFLGSYGHASPEQLLGKEVTSRSDLYSLAGTLYEMLAGSPLFPDLRDGPAMGKAHIDRRPLPLQERAPLIAPEIAEIVMRALDKDPSARPKDAHAFRQPFTLVRNRILREQAQSAGHSTIERFLANSVAGAAIPVEVGAGAAIGVADSSPKVAATTTPGEPLWGGTHPDRHAGQPASGQEAVVPFEPTLELRSDSLLAATPIQPSAALGGRGTDSTSTHDVAAQGGAGTSRQAGKVALARPRPRAPYLLLRISLIAAALVGTMFAVRLLRRADAPSTRTDAVEARVAVTVNSPPMRSGAAPETPPTPAPGSSTSTRGLVASEVDASVSPPATASVATPTVATSRPQPGSRPKPAQGPQRQNPFEDRK